MEVSKSKIEQAVELIADGGVSECVVTVRARVGKDVELSFQEWLRVGKLVNARYGFTEAADWEEPSWYGIEVIEVD